MLSGSVNGTKGKRPARILQSQSGMTTSSHKKTSFTDIQTLRRHAREHIMQGAVTPDYQGDLEASIQLLNGALAGEIVCFLRYKSHYYLASGIHSKSIAQEFAEHAQEEMMHAEQISERIKQLDGEPNWNPEGILSRSHAEFKNGETLVDLLREDLIAERIAITAYRELVHYFGEKDPTSRRLIENILGNEEEHAQELMDLLLTLDPAKRAESAA
jgi:bacterioferritin